MSKRGVKLYLNDIKGAIEKIEKYTQDLDLKKFANDSKTIDAVVRNLTIIGEAVNYLPEEIKIQYPNIPWQEIAGMRNKIIHEYFGVDEDILWKTVTEDIKLFKQQLAKLSNGN